MNLDANIQKLITVIMRKWKVVIVFALIATILSVFYTAKFTTFTYSSSVEFLSYAEDTKQELNESSSAAQQASNTSKMNYAIKMLDTYIELFTTNKFNNELAEEINAAYGTSYSGSMIKRSIQYTKVEETAMFKASVTTTDAELSYRIAHQLETSIPEKMASTNNGLVKASVEDAAVKAGTYENRGYLKKAIIGFMAGAVVAVAYIILRDLLDIRIKSSDELSDIYDIPVLGTIPEFSLKSNIAKREAQDRAGREM